MKNTYNKLTCLFGHHQYSRKPTENKDGYPIHLCKICKRRGYYKYNDGSEIWYDYDGEGNKIHIKWDDGDEYWYDEEGNCIHVKYSDGDEKWKNNNNRWTTKKPENWKYDTQ